MRMFWSEIDLDYLKANYPGIPILDIAKSLNRSYASVGSMVSKLGLRKVKDIYEGQIFTYLTVIEKSPKKGVDGQSYYFCKCKCDNTKEVSGRCLNSGDTKSCGCIRIDSGKKRRHPPGEVSFNHLYVRLQNNSKNRKGDKAICDLSYEEFKSIAIQDCYYCGEKPRAFNKYLKLDGTREAGNALRMLQETVDRATIFVNTIDRVNSDIGYIASNCVPCCWPCNSMKSDTEENSFISQVYKIVAFQESKKK
jgi:hypothetical protein